MELTMNFKIFDLLLCTHHPPILLHVPFNSIHPLTLLNITSRMKIWCYEIHDNSFGNTSSKQAYWYVLFRSMVIIGFLVMFIGIWSSHDINYLSCITYHICLRCAGIWCWMPITDFWYTKLIALNSSDYFRGKLDTF